MGGKCLPLQVDIRYEEQIAQAIEKTVSHFGGLDILINNASAISLTSTENTTMKKFDLMHQINTRGTFIASKYAIEHLKKSSHAHILNMSPPLEMRPDYFKDHLAYTMAKYGMSLCVLGMAKELEEHKIAVNALWPRTAIWTAAMNMLAGEDGKKMSRKPEIVADAAYAILLKSPTEFSGNFCIDEEVLQNEGVTDLDQYAMVPGQELLQDYFLPEKYLNKDSPSIPKKKEATGLQSDVERIFSMIEKLMTDSLKNEINASILFTISGNHFLLNALQASPFKITYTEEKADVTIMTDEDTFCKIAKGQLKTTNAFMSGKLKVKGNLGIAIKVDKLFSQSKSKL